MMTIKISHYKKIFNIVSGNVYELVIENPREYYTLGKQIIDLDENSIILYDGEIKDNEKNICCVENLFNIDPNSKKNLTATYKKLSVCCNTDEIHRIVSDINTKTFELFDLISQEFDSSITYETDVQLIDLLSLYVFKYNLNTDSFVDNFVSFVKASLQNVNIKVLFTFNLFDFIDENDYKLLKKELSLMDLTLINICSKKSFIVVDDRIIIDKDLCEI